ncbi:MULTISPECIES: helix-turn-helix domain-containing protein [unclassified Enterococcus]|jgi:hypothetical protein|uniref:helix-turn-helix domain-containing protein n=1 Tax=unclassified Enterococcus TaxID=2608891 RepID=UPI003D2B26F0
MYLSSNYLKNFDKDLYYKILLLESFEDQNWHTAIQLGNAVQLDARSVTKYLNDLAKSYQLFSKKENPLFLKSRKGYTFSESLDPIEHERFLIYLVQNTLKFQLVHDIFFEDFRTMYQFAQKHYISESTAHRKINEWKKQLSSYGITLQRKTYVATGEEEIIRLYLHMTFWQLFRGKIWPFKTISQAEVQRMAEEIMLFFDVRFNEIKKRRLEYMLGAFFLRKSQKHFVTLTTKKKELLVNNLLFKQFCNAMIPIFPNYFQVEDELGALFLIFMTREEYYTSPHIRKLIFTFHLNAKTPPFQALTYAKKAISDYQKELDFKEKLTPEAENYLLSGHMFAYLFPEAKKTIDGKVEELNSKQVGRLGELTGWLEHFFEEAKQTGNQTFENTSFLFHRYLFVLKTMKVFMPKLPKIKLLLMTDFSIFEEELIMKEITEFFKNSYRLQFLPTDYRGREVDLLMSTSKVHGKPWADFDYFIVQQSLQLDDFIELSKKFKLIEQEKQLKD